MTRQGPKAMQCAEFEALLAEALDGRLSPAEMERLAAHAAECPLCAPAMTLAEQGRSLLRGLPEIEPPAYLVQKILNVTSEVAPEGAAEPQPAGQWSWNLRPFFAAVMQPRFGMSVAMAFFSVTLVLNVAGIKIGDLRYVDLRPSAVKSNVVKGYYETTGRVQRYYDNLRLVYQVQSTLRDLRNATQENEAQPQQKPQPQQQPQPPRPGSDTSEQEKREKNERYSVERPQVVMAAATERHMEFVEDRRNA